MGPLQDNGGPTFTHALLPGSPAIDAADPKFTPPPYYDQRGPVFWRVRNGRIDVGSFEVQAGTTPSPTPTPTATATANSTATLTPPPTPTPSEPPCEVIGSQPACNSTVSTQVTDFTVYLSYFITGARPSDFTVNGIPADDASVVPTNIIYHFNSTPRHKHYHSEVLRYGYLLCSG